jgi:hypothetical protein
MARTDNDFWIGSNGRTLAPTLPIVIGTKQQAYRTAAWLKAMAVVLPDEDEASTYDEVEEAIQNT